jgi:hypothetical protein
LNSSIQQKKKMGISSSHVELRNKKYPVTYYGLEGQYRRTKDWSTEVSKGDGSDQSESHWDDEKQSDNHSSGEEQPEEQWNGEEQPEEQWNGEEQLVDNRNEEEQLEMNWNAKEPPASDSPEVVPIENIRNDLETLVEVGQDLLDTLLKMELLTEQQTEVIRNAQEPNEQVSLLLDDVNDMSPYQQAQFLVALENTGQSFVAAYIRTSGHWPLADCYLEPISLDDQQMEPVQTTDPTDDLLN